MGGAFQGLRGHHALGDDLLVLAVLAASFTAITSVVGVAPLTAGEIHLTWLLVSALPGLAVTHLLAPDVFEGSAARVGVAIAMGCAIQPAILLVLVRAPGGGTIGPLLALTIASVVVLALTIRRRRARDRPQDSTARAPWFVALLLAVAGFQLWSATVAPPDLPADGFRYYTDLPFHQSLAGELKSHVPPGMPFMGGGEYGYHWFGHADIALRSLLTGSSPATILFGAFALPLLAATGMLLVALLRVVQPEAPGWAEVVVAISPLLFGEFDVLADKQLTFLGVYQENLLFSPTFTYGLPVFLALALLTARSAPMALRRQSAGFLLAAAVLAAGATGAKVTALPTLFLALPLALGIVAIGRGVRPRIRPTIALLAAFAVGFVVTAPFIYQSTGGGALELSPLGTIRRLADAGQFPPTALGAVIGLAGTVPVLILVALAPRTVWSRPAAVLLACCTAVAVGGFLVFDHPGFSQFYILAYGITAAFPLAVVGLIGLVDSLRRHGVGRGIWVPAVGTPLAIGGIVSWRSSHTPATTAVTAAASFAAVLLVLVWDATSHEARRWPRLVGLSVGMTLVVSAGLDFPLDAAADVRAAGQADLSVTADTATDFHLDLGGWAREATGPDDLLAVDVHHRGPDDARFFTTSAFTERRIYIESWAYAPAALSGSVGVPEVFAQRLRRNEAAFRADAGALEDLRRARVAFLVHDRRFGYGDEASLAEELPIAFQNPRFVVFGLSDLR